MCIYLGRDEDVMTFCVVKWNLVTRTLAFGSGGSRGRWHSGAVGHADISKSTFSKVNILGKSRYYSHFSRLLLRLGCCVVKRPWRTATC